MNDHRVLNSIIVLFSISILLLVNTEIYYLNKNACTGAGEVREFTK